MTQARANAIAAGATGSPEQRAQAENVLTGALRSVFAVAENYPQLQAVQEFNDLSENLTATEDKIAFARRFYNGNVRDYNTALQTFPTNILAGMFGFTRAVLRARGPDGARSAEGVVQLTVVAAPGPRLNIYDAVAANRWRTVALIAVFTAIVSALAYAAGEYFAPGGGIALLPVAIGFSGVSAAASYFAGDKLVLAQSQARPLADGAEPQLRNIVDTLSIGLGIQSPTIYVIDDSAPNAFATGRDPQHASIAVTRGLLDKLDRTELEGVLAHEMSHVVNRDIRVMLLVTVLVGTVALLSDWLLRSMSFGGGARRGTRPRRRRWSHRHRDRARDPHAGHRDAHPARGVATARVPRRRLGRAPHPLPARPRVRAPQDRCRQGAARGGEQGDGVALHREPAQGRPAGHGRTVRHASADRRAHPPPRGDVR